MVSSGYTRGKISPERTASQKLDDWRDISRGDADESQSLSRLFDLVQLSHERNRWDRGAGPAGRPTVRSGVKAVVISNESVAMCQEPTQQRLAINCQTRSSYRLRLRLRPKILKATRPIRL